MPEGPVFTGLGKQWWAMILYFPGLIGSPGPPGWSGTALCSAHTPRTCRVAVGHVPFRVLVPRMLAQRLLPIYPAVGMVYGFCDFSFWLLYGICVRVYLCLTGQWPVF